MSDDSRKVYISPLWEDATRGKTSVISHQSSVISHHSPPSPHPTQCVANHINPFPFLPGFEDRPAPKCPHCEQTIDATLMAREKEERESKSISGLLVHMRNHMSMRGRARTCMCDQPSGIVCALCCVCRRA